MDIAKEDRTLDSCAHRGKVQPCRNRSRQRIGTDMETTWDDDVFPIGVAIVMMTLAMAVFFVSFAVTRRWKSCTMDSSQLCAAHCEWSDDSFNARHIKHQQQQQQQQKCNSLHDFHLEWQKSPSLRLFSPLLPSLPGSP